MSTTSVGNTAGTGSVYLGADVGSLSIEDALILVQMDRVRLCESQLQDQINSIRDKNDQMRKLNDMKGQLLALKSAFADDAKGTDSLSGQDKWKNNTDKIQDTANSLSDSWSKAGLDPNYVDKIKSGSLTKGEIDAADQIIKSSVDSLSSSSQMDMVRLQSLNNKRSEAFDTMTNMLKKAADSKSSVVSNFR